MVRKQVYIEPSQEKKLKRLSKASGVSEASLIRTAIDRVLVTVDRGMKDRDAWQREKARMLARARQGPLPARKRWTREELYLERHRRDG